MKNKHLDIVARAINEIELDLTQGRTRKIFYKEINDKIKEREDNRIEIAKSIGEFDEKQNMYLFDTKEKQTKFLKEYDLLMEEAVGLVISDEIKSMLTATKAKMTAQEYDLIDELLNNSDEILK